MYAGSYVCICMGDGYIQLGGMTWTIWVTGLGHFFCDQVGSSTKFYVCDRILCTCSLENRVGPSIIYGWHIVVSE